MPIINRMTFEEMSSINERLNKRVDGNTPERDKDGGATFWDFIEIGMNAIDGSETKLLMFETGR